MSREKKIIKKKIINPKITVKVVGLTSGGGPYNTAEPVLLSRANRQVEVETLM